MRVAVYRSHGVHRLFSGQPQAETATQWLSRRIWSICRNSPACLLRAGGSKSMVHSSGCVACHVLPKRRLRTRRNFHLGQIKLRHIGTPQQPIFATGRDVDLMQTTCSLANRRAITAAELFKMKANQLGVPTLEITRERMFSR